MNSVFNEHPSRRIDESFIKRQMEQAAKENVCFLLTFLIRSLLPILIEYI